MVEALGKLSNRDKSEFGLTRSNNTALTAKSLECSEGF